MKVNEPETMRLRFLIFLLAVYVPAQTYLRYNYPQLNSIFVVMSLGLERQILLFAFEILAVAQRIKGQNSFKRTKQYILRKCFF